MANSITAISQEFLPQIEEAKHYHHLGHSNWQSSSGLLSDPYSAVYSAVQHCTAQFKFCATLLAVVVWGRLASAQCTNSLITTLARGQRLQPRPDIAWPTLSYVICKISALIQARTDVWRLGGIYNPNNLDGMVWWEGSLHNWMSWFNFFLAPSLGLREADRAMLTS